MDLCGPIRVESVNGKKYILVIVDDYSRFTWVKFLRSKDETPMFIIKFLKMIQVRLNVPVRCIRTDNGTEFVNQTLWDYYEEVVISHETSVARSPQQNGVIERRNRTLIEAARTMLIYAHAPLFLWAAAVATACFTQNRSIIRIRHGKTLYELLHSKLPDLSFFHVFGALCYPTNDSENLETIHVDFDELTAMASEQSSSGPALNDMTPGTISSGLMRTSSSSTSYVPPSRNDWDLLFQPMFDELLNPPPSVVNQAAEVIAPIAETPYELLHSKLPDLSFFYVFGALCYTTNDSENLSKLQPKADIEIFIGYAPTKKAFRIYNRRTRKNMETIHVDFDELTAMASEHRSSGPALKEMTLGTISSGLVLTTSPSTSYVPPLRND
nr:hypothetical protein [Tanacetum cinerariifolium]